MNGSILGTRVQRTEDPELLLGEGRYSADLDLGPETVHVAFARSEHAHARVLGIDTSAAAAVPGVVAVYTAADLGAGPARGLAVVDNAFDRPPLADGTVRFVGEPIVAVVAISDVIARDAAALVEVDYEPLPAVIDSEDALADGAPVIFAGRADNVAMSATAPVQPGIFGDADVVVRGRYVNQRLAVAPLEPLAAAAAPGEDGRLVVHASTQMPHLTHRLIADSLGVGREAVKVVVPHVGGGFGGKVGLYAEEAVVATVAHRLGRPAKWQATRSEDLVALYHSRGQVQYAELGCRRDGTFTGLRVRLVGDAGAYPCHGAFLPAGTGRMSNGTYRLDGIQFDIVVAATNTTPMGAYRGAGRPEATALLERLVDQAADELGIDPIELRKRNLIGSGSFPFSTLTGLKYDSGDYPTPLDAVAAAAGYDTLRAEQRARREAGDDRLLGIGVSTYVEITAGGNTGEYGALQINPDGSATIKAGTSAHGQGHQTSFAMIVNAQTGIPIEKINLRPVDTDEVPTGGGTGGSRSLQLGGSAVWKATESVVDKAKRLAAHLLEASADDIVVDTVAGTLGVAGVPSASLDWATLAAHAASEDADAVDHSDGTNGLGAQLDFQQGAATFPFGAHIAVVEVDRETGRVTLLRHIAVDDCGTVLNPLLVEGQQHGGAAAGISQTLYEAVRYDADGNPLTSTFADYGIPSAAEFPSFEVHSTETPTPLNPLGAKGIGEASTIGATPAVQNAIIDAVRHLGVRHIDLPCTPEAVWQAITAAVSGQPVDPWREPPAVFARLAGGQEVDEAGLAAAEGV